MVKEYYIEGLTNMNRKSVGIRQMVEFVLRGGDLDPASTSSQNTALEGTRIHRKLQKEWEKTTKKEVYLKTEFEAAKEKWLLHGRADALHMKDNKYDEVREIKTSALKFEELSQNTLTLYFGQAKVYAYLLMEQNDLEQLKLSLYYFQTTTEKLTIKTIDYTKDEATEFFENLLKEFTWWIEFKAELRSKRNISCQKLSFPFPQYRQNQHELSAAVYKTIYSHKRLFVEAPTGTGKTISTLFPTIKALGEKRAERIFYFTAKQSTRRVAEETCALLEDNGLYMHSITLTAKDKITFAEEQDIADTENPYFLGYYDRIKPAMKDILTNETLLTREVIEKYAAKHTVDPFEFSLDVSLFCDTIICDYNYLFDPLVYLQRFFSEKDPGNIFLIDEAHNLVQRARLMYTKEISSIQLDKLIETYSPQTKKASRLLDKMEQLREQFQILKEPMRNYRQDSLIVEEEFEGFKNKLQHFTDFINDWLQEHPEDESRQEVLDYFFQCHSYLKISEFYGPEFRTKLTYEQDQDELRLKIFCIDPSELIDQQLQLGGGSILFSATLSPLGYYQEILGGKDSSLAYRLPSPFSPANLAILVPVYIQTTYKKRAENQANILQALKMMTSAKKGNYLVFLPSYSYLTTIVTAFCQEYPEQNVAVQKNEMDAKQREQFLANFQSDLVEPVLGFAVLGGIFSEGIDLKGDRLSGVAIISVGLPPNDPELDTLKEYYSHQGKDGFQYAYQLPGINNVFQAAGRVIRDEQDHGVVMLIDARFNQRRYTSFYPPHWQNYHAVYSSTELKTTLANFWKHK